MVSRIALARNQEHVVIAVFLQKVGEDRPQAFFDQSPFRSANLVAAGEEGIGEFRNRLNRRWIAGNERQIDRQPAGSTVQAGSS
ncbi:MAG: hypothetical protein FD149_2521 [Rhodospirillaceae bacterium]|nr:MAG: hypothetical protein FD149_2521 [Rhodospirillaceae bacterium]